ncbi:hypothetical protein QTI24_13635 [Variovorax sp. J22P240]|uniref:hypothetical protein n=1 Tax=unclassified Variovorax TaxID=663243 RepID=UPI0025755CC9|nr:MULTISPECIES: hypothetical protein [unclassified Variovorax]MDL9999656.1 hypothetical protein [Variovorax sp. J22P240]MDM0049079.1 hypothetical protein [Variovorax sp. J22R115]
MFKARVLATSFVIASAVLPMAVPAQTPAAPAAAQNVRVRGVIVHVDAKSLTVKDRSGEVVTMVRPADMRVIEVLPVTAAAIKPNSFVGAGSMPQPDGTQRAVEVLVFPESMRGTGEGFRPWDYMPNGTMTNATVSKLSAAPAAVPGGQKLVLKYKDGEKTVIVPRGTPIVTFKPGKDDQSALVVPGAKVVVTAQMKDGQPTASSLLVGRNGFTPPM